MYNPYKMWFQVPQIVEKSVEIQMYSKGEMMEIYTSGRHNKSTQSALSMKMPSEISVLRNALNGLYQCDWFRKVVENFFYPI
jgi:hypothetical protein